MSLSSRKLYAIHRWVSALALIQLAVWTATGLFFAVVPIGRVRGTNTGATLELTDAKGLVPPAQALVAATRAGASAVSSLTLTRSPAGVFYVARAGEASVRIDAKMGQVAPVTEAEAKEIARRDQPGNPKVISTLRVERDPNIEYREKPLPAWRVTLDDEPRTAIYVDARTGDVTARRNDIWRWYDFFWSLHIMDYSGRDSFNHPLIIGAAILAVITVMTGIILWVLRIVRWRRRRPLAAPTAKGNDSSDRPAG